LRWSYLHKLIYDIIRSTPGIHVAEICRRVNNESIRTCRRAHKYAPWAKGSWITKCPCKIKYTKVLAIVRDLERLGLIRTRIERRRDPDVSRGYDFFRCCYPRDYESFQSSRQMRILDYILGD